VPHSLILQLTLLFAGKKMDTPAGLCRRATVGSAATQTIPSNVQPEAHSDIGSLAICSRHKYMTRSAEKIRDETSQNIHNHSTKQLAQTTQPIREKKVRQGISLHIDTERKHGGFITHTRYREKKRKETQAYPSSSLYFSPLLSSAASKRSITPNTFSSSSLRPITCTPTGSPAIFTAS